MAKGRNGGARQRVLVTGAAGYIGTILCEHLLDAGHEVIALDTLAFGGGSLFHLCARPGFDFHLGDARDERVLRDLVPQADVLTQAIHSHDIMTYLMGPIASVFARTVSSRPPRLPARYPRASGLQGSTPTPSATHSGIISRSSSR